KTRLYGTVLDYANIKQIKSPTILDDVIDQTEMIGEDTVEPTVPSERPKRNAKLPIRFRNDYILE
ncbi:hypothetical protein A3Q56_08734, partial [Intoshia linei]